MNSDNVNLTDLSCSILFDFFHSFSKVGTKVHQFLLFLCQFVTPFFQLFFSLPAILVFLPTLPQLCLASLQLPYPDLLVPHYVLLSLFNPLFVLQELHLLLLDLFSSQLLNLSFTLLNKKKVTSSCCQIAFFS